MTRVLGLVHGEFSSHTMRVLEVAKALRQKRGFDVIFSGEGEYMDAVRREGFECVPGKTVSKRDIMDEIEKKLFPRVFNRDNIDELFEAENETLIRVKPDIIVRDCFRELAGIAAKSMGIFDVFLQQASLTPYYHADFKPSNTPGYLRLLPGERVLRLPYTDFAPLIRLGEFFFRKSGSKFLHKKVRDLGMKVDDKTYEGIEADLVLIPDSEILFPFKYMKENYKFVGPILVLNQSKTPSWRNEFVSDKRVKIITTSGTTGEQDRGNFFSEAFRDGKYAVALHGRKVEGEAYSGNFEISSLIDCSSLLITHGGQGSTYLGLTREVPMIAIYKHFEQQINANQMKKLGVGLAIDARRISPSKLRGLVDEVIENDSYRERASNIGQKITREGSVGRAAEIIIDKYCSRS